MAWGWRKKVAPVDVDTENAVAEREKTERQIAELQARLPALYAQTARVDRRRRQNGFGHELELVIRPREA